jgi:hypothetical protein
MFLQALSLLAWQRAVEEPGRWPWRLLLFLSLALSPLTHFFGVLNYLPVMAGEAWRSISRRHISRNVAIPVGLSLFAVALLPPLAQKAVEMREAFWASGYGLSTPLDSYRFLLGDMLLPVVLLLLAGLFLATSTRRDRQAVPRAFASHELVAILVQIAMPLVVLLLAIVYTNAITHRYAIISCFGFALLAAQAVELLRLRLPAAAAILAVLLFVWSGRVLYGEAKGASAEALHAELANSLAAVELPVVVENARCFLQSYHYLDEGSKNKLHYLTDRARSRRYLGHDNDEIAIAHLGDFVALNTEDYDGFAAGRRDFLLLADRSRGWLMDHLQAEAAQLESIEQVGEWEMFRVRLPAVD